MNVDGLKSTVKRYRLVEWIKKQDSESKMAELAEYMLILTMVRYQKKHLLGETWREVCSGNLTERIEMPYTVWTV